MSDIETAVAEHYTTGELTARVISALKELGIDADAATPDDLKAGDEFHTGGVEATEHFFGHLTVTSSTRVLDVGSGIGGTSRFVSDRFGANVTGVDLTPEFVETAAALTEMVGLSDKVRFLVGSALAMPVPDATFDLAILMHVGMNIEDKAALFSEVARVLAPGGIFAVFDVMKGTTDEDLVFPLPWSSRPETSFLAPPAVYADAADSVALRMVLEEDRSEFALDFFARVFAKTQAEGPAPLGIHLMMGQTAGEKLGNYVTNLKAGRLRPVEMIFEKAA
ncbi:MAG: methyltransferase domain-containing protein [Pseudomonadota bacterium]